MTQGRPRLIIPRGTAMSLYVVHVRRRAGVPVEDVHSILNAAKDWYQLSNATWLVVTSRSPDVWTERLMSIVEPGGQSLVLCVEPGDHQGWMDDDFWSWFNRAISL